MSLATLIINAHIVDPDQGTVSYGSLLIHRGRVEEHGDAVDSPPEVLDARGAYLCPGLIDSHVHLFLDAGPDPRSAFLESGDAAKWDTAVSNASRALAAGITTVRDCGAPAHLIFEFRRKVENGEIAGPRVLTCGSPLTRPRGHCHFFGIEVSSTADVRQAIENQAREGADFVKLIASGGGLTPGTSPGEADLSLELMREATSVAAEHGMHVAAHCHATESIRRSLAAGIDIIEHASFTEPSGVPSFNDELAAQLRDQGTVVCPTVISGLNIAATIKRAGTANGSDRNAVARLQARREHTARFTEMGVRILAGTDCGVANTGFDSLLDELEAYVNAGMSRAAALRAATTDAARVLGQPDLGNLQPGSQADLVLLDANPLDDLGCLRTPQAVFKAGEIVFDRRHVTADAR